MAQVALRLQFLYQFLEWQILMRISSERCFPLFFQQVLKGRIKRKVASQDNRVNKESDHLFYFNSIASGYRAANAYIVFARVAMQQGLEGRQHRHKKRYLLATA